VFHLVNVVDDLEMGITQVIRGEDHLSNTAKHIALFRAFGVEPPKFAHIPLILNADGSKMSKRDVGAELQAYVDSGFNPDAVVNYLGLLGWTPKELGEQFTKEQAAAVFDLPQVHRSNARFDMKKLEHFHFEHTRRMTPESFVKTGIETLSKSGIATQGYPAEYIRAALLTAQEKGKLFKELPLWVDFFFCTDDAVVFDAEAKAKALTPAAKPVLEKLQAAFGAVAEFNAPQLEASLKSIATELGVKAGALVQPCRMACTGRLVGPSLYHLMEVLGRDRVLARLQRAAATCSQ
jgi:glutamyl-tRNA synthetase